MDFALNGLQASLRNLLLDVTPPGQLSVGNAWHGRMTNAGNIVGYGFGEYRNPTFGYTDTKAAPMFRVPAISRTPSYQVNRRRAIQEVLCHLHDHPSCNCLDYLLVS